MSEREFCTNCGTERRPGAKFCARCGTRFEGSIAENRQTEAPAETAAVTPTPPPPTYDPVAPAVLEAAAVLPRPTMVPAAALEAGYLGYGVLGAAAGILLGGVYWWIASRIGPLPGVSFLFRTGPATHLVLAAIITGVLTGLATVIFAGRRTLPLQLMAGGASILALLLGRFLLALGSGVTLGAGVFFRVGLRLPLFMEFIICAASAAVAASPIFPYSRAGSSAQAAPSMPRSSLGAVQASEARRATGQEHYVLQCRSCDFEHHIPSDIQDASMRYSVAPAEVKMTCLYGGAFTVSLKLQEFFTIEPTPSAGRVLHASIGDNMKAMHVHLLSHCDPLFLQIDQTPNSTHHTYLKQQPAASSFVKFSSTTGIDMVGNINIAKAEIPGIS